MAILYRVDKIVTLHFLYIDFCSVEIHKFIIIISNQYNQNDNHANIVYILRLL